ncbi:dTDP-4-amino-4,6-dideoxygalactose transaminase [Pseudobutyrivibrio ruminis]|uniref:dTDP-4-amino-4,6-dideoxygalactose transaminase n=1 Tax=Pseudobutyrivibrio ruminis TaxID=46206 RepID=A0A1H7KAR3_9FIRM|nr:DegT/DnrJ/EryC1/StrS family aminotransferase [Pseudobutyrivibrio ruminis]SEK83057.1 dTDP-4-amino-4,6-dideoxygalactose transaminase [Pseudobutyrivibrio ruminis]
MQKDKILVTRSSMPPYEEYIEAIKPLWDSHWLTNMGQYHKELELQLAEYLDVPEISLTVNGHMALELAIQSFDFPEGAEVITTPFTFISTTHAIVRNKLQPVFCDVKEDDGTIDETKIEDLITEKTVAILPVHVYGNVCNVEAIQEIADKYNLKVIYDAAHAFGEKYLGKGIGNYGDVSIFSFHATKVFNTIEGGAVVCKNHERYERLRDLKNFGIRGEELVVAVGANAKMNEFAAIMGLCNLKHIDKAIEARKRICEYYFEEISKIEGIEFYNQRDNATHNYGYFPIKVTDRYPLTRDELYQKLREDNIYTRKYFYPLTADQACFKNKYKDKELMIARKLSKESMVLPLYEGLEEKYQRKIIDIIKNY